MTTPNRGIPYVPENTLDPAAGLNLSLDVIDAVMTPSVISIGDTAPPGSPADGDLYIVGVGTGAWAGQNDNLARYRSEGAFWQFYTGGTQVNFVLNLDDGLPYANLNDSNGWNVIGVEGESAGPGGGGSLQFVDESIVSGAAATDITVSGLDLDTDGTYIVDLVLDNGSVSTTNVSLFYNGDTTVTNYHREFVSFANTTVAAARANDANMGSVLTTESLTARLTIWRDFDGLPRCLYQASRSGATALVLIHGTHHRTSSANVTSLTINSSIASAFSINSRVSVWRQLRE
jgi:hypothetical protein